VAARSSNLKSPKLSVRQLPVALRRVQLHPRLRYVVHATVARRRVTVPPRKKRVALCRFWYSTRDGLKVRSQLLQAIAAPELLKLLIRQA